MIDTTNQNYLLPPVNHADLTARAEDISNPTDAPFSQLYEKARDQSSEPKTLDEAGRRMEVMITTMVLKTMEESSTEGGLLGTKSQGMGYFKDLFLENIAENMVEKGGLGIREALVKAHGPN
jgi:Rod binding domain-containing protein